MVSKKKYTGVVILAGLFDQCGEIGSQQRFGIIPIPWQLRELALQVSGLISTEKAQKNFFEKMDGELPLNYPDELRTEELQGGKIGLRIWVYKGEKLGVLIKLLQTGTVTRAQALLLDKIGLGDLPTEFEWSSDIQNEEKLLEEFSNFLFCLIQ